MNIISLRDFQLRAGDYIDNLPIIITRYNVPIAKIVPIKDDDTSVDTSVDDKENTKSWEEIGKMCQYPRGCFKPGVREVIVPDNTGNDMTYFLCEEHASAAENE